VFHLFGALAQFEREIIRDRMVAGQTAARDRGRVGGRPSKLTPEQRRQARRMYDARELTVEQIGAVLGVSRTSIYRALGKTTTQVPSTWAWGCCCRSAPLGRSAPGWCGRARPGGASCSLGRPRDRPADRRPVRPVAVDVSGLLPEPSGYAELLEQLKARVRTSRVRAARAANSELLGLYWSVGWDMLDRQEQAGRVIDRLATDLRAEFPDQRG